MGWDAHQPITLPDFDLLQPAGRELARRYLQEVDPDLLVLSFPCTEWSQLQQINQRTPFQIRQLRRRRREQLHLLAFVNEMSQWQASRGRAVLVENPERSQAWDTAPMNAMRMHPWINETVTDMSSEGLIQEIWSRSRPSFVAPRRSCKISIIDAMELISTKESKEA